MKGGKSSISAARPGSGSPDTVSWYRWYALFVLTMCYVFSHIDATLPSILLEDLKKDLNLSDSMVGLITGPAFSLTYAFAAVPIAKMSDRSSRRIVIATAVAVWSFFTAAGGLVVTGFQLTFSRIGVALGEAALTPAAHSLIADYFPPSLRGRAISIYATGAIVGTVLALAGGGFLAAHFGWRATLVVAGGLGLILSLLTFTTLVEPARTAGPEETGEGTSTIRELLRNRVVRNSVLGCSFLGLTLGSASAWGVAYVVRTYQVDVATVGAIFGATAGVLGLLGILLGGFLNDTFSRRKLGGGYQVLAAAFLAAAVLRCGALSGGDFTTYMIMASLSTFLLMLYPGPTFATIQSMVSAHARSRAVAVTLLALNAFGIAGGTFLTGIISDLLAPTAGARSLEIAMLVMLIPLPIAALFYWRASVALNPGGPARSR